jgi:ubiquinone biosynthesis protein COQ4
VLDPAAEAAHQDEARLDATSGGLGNPGFGGSSEALRPDETRAGDSRATLLRYTQVVIRSVASIRPLRAAQGIRAIFADPDDTKQVFKVIEALQGPALMRTHGRMTQSETGRRLLQTRPDLLAVLCDRERLAALPEGTLGHAYLAFVESEGITADGLVEASLVAQPILEPELAWVRNWLRDTHDLWHTVLGYRGDLVGEAALLAFSHTESSNWGVGLIAAFAWLKLGRVTEPSLHARKHVVDGRRIARRAAWFLDVPWHEWLDRPLADVRRDLGISGPVEYTPVRASEIDNTLFGRRRAKTSH